MIHNDKQLGIPFTQYTDTKDNIEALTGISIGAVAYATDIKKPGWYNGTTWVWSEEASVGTGIAGRVAEWATASILQATTLAKIGAGLLTLSSAGDYTLTVPATGTTALGANTLSVATTNDATGSAHTHAVTSSSNPGAAASLLASDANGYLQLKRLGINTAPEYGLDVNGDIRIPYTGAIRLGSSAWPSNILINYTWDATFYDQIKFYVPQSGATATIPRMILHNTGAAFNATTRYSASSSMEIFGVIGHASVYILAKSVSGATTNTALYFVPTQSDTLVGASTIQYGLDTTASYGNFLVFAPAKSGSARIYFTQTGAVGFNTYTPGGHLQLNNPNADTVATIVQAAANQTADLSRWQSSTGVVNAKIAANFSATFKLTDTATNTVGTALTLGHNSSSTPTAGFGNALLFTLASSTTADQNAGRLYATWYDATHATRRGDIVLSAFDYGGEREGLRVRADGSAPAIAFYGGTPRTRAAALTAQLTTITYTAPTTPDYAIQDFVDVAGDGSKGYAFASRDEANTLLAVIANLQTRVQQLENALNAATGVNLIA